ncbi:hypothetical protein KAR34_08600 [bacterium]|nr:hypothetical protein [bacterium]
MTGYRSYRVTDDYSGYDGMGISEGIIHVLCWAYARN